MPHPDRRAFLGLATAGILSGPILGATRLRPRRARRLLVFTKSSGYVHSIVAPDADGRTTVERTLFALGRDDGFEILATKDGRVFSSAAFAEFGAFLFVTTGNLLEPGTDGQPPMTAAGKQALLDAVADGKGFVGVHNAADTFPSPPAGPVDPYIAMLGGEFEVHGQPQRATVRVTDATFPGFGPGAGAGTRTERSPATIRRLGEWYAFRHVAPDIHPLLVLETSGLEGDMYRRPPFPVAWTRRHGKGRVAYNALGHFDAEWSDAVFRDMLLGMVQWALGDVQAGAG